MEEIFCNVAGRVQMVMFRDFTKRNARWFGLVGYVKNRADGTVEVLAQGDHDKLQKLVDRIKKGSLLSRVEKVQVEWRKPSAAFKSFDIVF